jgi:hypothetical protein
MAGVAIVAEIARVLPAIHALALARELAELRRQVRPGSAEAAAVGRAQGATANALHAAALGLVEDRAVSAPGPRERSAVEI